MSNTSSFMIALSAIAIGLGVPGVCVYASIFYGFNFVAAAAVAFIAVLVGGGIAIVGVVEGPLGRVFDDSGRVERQRLRVLREQQKDTLEELDGIVGVLGEIRDLLKAVEE
jgi:hypothetical protein